MNKEHLHAQVQQLHEEGYSIRGIAHETGMSKSSVGRIVKQLQNLSYGTVTETSPTYISESTGTLSSTESQDVPEIDLSTLGTIEDQEINENEHEQAVQQRKQDEYAYEMFMMRTHKHNLHSSYQDFLYYTRSFLTNNLGSDKLARELIQSRQQRIRDFIMRARGICINCKINYESLFMSYVLTQLYIFLGQQPELEDIECGFRVKAGAVLEQYIKQVERLDVFTPIGNSRVRFPDI